MNCKVSIIISVYRAERYLVRCLESIRSQTLGDFEAILVDDGSPDRSGEIMARYAAADPRFKVISHENMGGGASRNIAMRLAGGEFVYVMDSDDRMHPQLLECACHFAEKHRADVVNFDFWKDSPFEIEDIPVSDFDAIPFIMTRDPLLRMKKKKFRYHIQYWAKLYRRELLANHPFLVHPDPARKHINSDLVHTVCIAADHPRALILGCKLYYYSYNRDSVTRKSLSLNVITDETIILGAILDRLREKRDLKYFKYRLVPRRIRQLYRKVHSLKEDPVKHREALDLFRAVLAELAARGLFKWRGHKLKDYLLYRRILRRPV